MRISCLIFLAFLLMGGVAAGEEAAKKRILIFSNMSSSLSDDFYALLEQENPSIDGSFRPMKLDESDYVVYLLKSWSDANHAPGSEELPKIFEALDTIKKPATDVTLKVSFRNGHNVKFIFYSLADSDYPSLECIARHLALEVSRKQGDRFENNTVRDCPAKLEQVGD